MISMHICSSDIADSLRTRVHAIVRNLEKKASKPKVRKCNMITCLHLNCVVDTS